MRSCVASSKIKALLGGEGAAAQHDDHIQSCKLDLPGSQPEPYSTLFSCFQFHAIVLLPVLKFFRVYFNIQFVYSHFQFANSRQ